MDAPSRKRQRLPRTGKGRRRSQNQIPVFSKDLHFRVDELKSRFEPTLLSLGKLGMAARKAPQAFAWGMIPFSRIRANMRWAACSGLMRAESMMRDGDSGGS